MQRWLPPIPCSELSHLVGRFGSGANAIRAIGQQLTERFVAATVSPDDEIAVADGGRNKISIVPFVPSFLLGRALHIVQDSFSTFHAIRGGEDYHEVMQVNSYLGTPHSPVHPRFTPGVKDLFIHDSSNGDVIWRDGCSSESSDCLKPEYAAAVEASRHIWAAFWRTHGAPAAQRERVAREEIGRFVVSWMTLPAPVTVPDSSEGGTWTVENEVGADRSTRCVAPTILSSNLSDSVQRSSHSCNRCRTSARWCSYSMISIRSTSRRSICCTWSYATSEVFVSSF